MMTREDISRYWEWVGENRAETGMDAYHAGGTDFAYEAMNEFTASLSESSREANAARAYYDEVDRTEEIARESRMVRGLDLDWKRLYPAADDMWF